MGMVITKDTGPLACPCRRRRTGGSTAAGVQSLRSVEETRCPGSGEVSWPGLSPQTGPWPAGVSPLPRPSPQQVVALRPPRLPAEARQPLLHGRPSSQTSSSPSSSGVTHVFSYVKTSSSSSLGHLRSSLHLKILHHTCKDPHVLKPWCLDVATPGRPPFNLQRALTPGQGRGSGCHLQGLVRERTEERPLPNSTRCPRSSQCRR